jgi:hypothetical protein
MASKIGINKNMNSLFTDLKQLMSDAGWKRLDYSTISTVTSSKSLKYTPSGTILAAPGRYSTTTGIMMYPGATLTGPYVQTNLDATVFSNYPTEFSITVWVNMANSVLRADSQISTAFLRGCYNSSTNRYGIDLDFDKDACIYKGFPPLLYLMENYFSDYTGKSWELLTFTFSTTTRTLTLYVNSTLVQQIVIDSIANTNLYYPILYSIGGTYTLFTFDQLVTWSKVLTAADILALVNKTTPVLSTDAYVTDLITNGVGVLEGGTYRNTCSNGHDIEVVIGVNSSNNIYLKTSLFTADVNVSGHSPADTIQVGTEAVTKYLCSVPPFSTEIVKYWLSVTTDRVIIAYKLLDITATRSTPLYQIGYVGKIKTLGSDGNNVFTAGTTTTADRLWTMVDNTDFRSGILYSTNNSYRLGYNGYISASVGHITGDISSFLSISNSVFMTAISVWYGTSYLGIVDGVYAISSSQATPESIITINSKDYIVLPDADVPIGNHYYALEL